MKTIVEVNNLTKFYGKNKVLSNVTLKIQEKEIVGLIGPNGAGKSTLMKCLTSLVFFQEGEIKICGYDIQKQREHALSVQSSLIEMPGMYPSMSGAANLTYFAKLRGCSEEQYQFVKEFTGLGDALKKKTKEYSLGMKQRLGLGIALLSEPKFLILDEPMNGLDPDGVISLRESLKYLVEEKKMSILISSHQLGEIEKMASRVIFLNHGEVADYNEALVQKKFYILESKQIDALIQTLANRETSCQYQKIGEYQILLETSGLNVLQKVLVEAEKQGIEISDIYKKTANIEDIYRQIFKGEA